MLLLERRRFEEPIRRATRKVTRKVTAALRSLSFCNPPPTAGLPPMLATAVTALLTAGMIQPQSWRPAKFKSLIVPDRPNCMPDPDFWEVQASYGRRETCRFKLTEGALSVEELFAHHFSPLNSVLPFGEFLLVEAPVRLHLPDDSEEIAHLCHRLTWLPRRVSSWASFSEQSLRTLTCDSRTIQLAIDCLNKHETVDGRLADENLRNDRPYTLVRVAWSMGLLLAAFAARMVCVLTSKPETVHLLGSNSQLKLVLRLAVQMAKKCRQLGSGDVDEFNRAWGVYSTGHAAWHFVTAATAVADRVPLQSPADAQVKAAMKEHAVTRRQSLDYSLTTPFTALHRAVTGWLSSNEASNLLKAELVLVAAESYEQAAYALIGLGHNVPV